MKKMAFWKHFFSKQTNKHFINISMADNDDGRCRGNDGHLTRISMDA